MFVNVRLIGPDGQVIENKGPTEDQVALEPARDNEPLRRALVIYGSLEHTWVNRIRLRNRVADGIGSGRFVSGRPGGDVSFATRLIGSSPILAHTKFSIYK